MTNRAIILHDPNSVRRLGPVDIRKDAVWTQDDSDTLAHFIQIHGQIAKSSWRQQKIELVSCGEETSGQFPDMEAFVYAAVYFRQLFSEKDHLFVDACDCYMRAVNSPVMAAWMHHEKEAGLRQWTSPGLMISTYTTQQIFDAMLYGAHLIHSLPNTRKKHRDIFCDILKNNRKERLLFEMHSSLLMMLNFVSRASAVIQQDYSNWLHTQQSPLPDVMWHESVFLAEVVNGRQPVK